MNEETISQEEARALKDALLTIELCLRQRGKGDKIPRRRAKLRAIKYVVEHVLQRAIEVEQ